MRTVAIFLLAVVFLAGCSTTPRVLDITTTPIDKPALVLPGVDKLNLKDVEWIVITESNVQEIWQRLSDDKKDIVLFGLTDDGYEQLTVNFADIMAMIQQQQAIIAAYKNYYEASEDALDKANTNLENVNKDVNNVNKKSKADADKEWWKLSN